MSQKKPVVQPFKKYRIYIGIDCGVETGIAVWWREQKKLLEVKSVKIHVAMGIVRRYKEEIDDVFVRVEDARLRKWIPKGKNEKEEKGKREGAGSVKRDAVIWEDLLTDWGIPFEMVAPKNNKTKTSADYFKLITGWQGVTNDHARDAAMLVYKL